jgi:hypothetical protein
LKTKRQSLPKHQRQVAISTSNTDASPNKNQTLSTTAATSSSSSRRRIRVVATVVLSSDISSPPLPPEPSSLVLQTSVVDPVTAPLPSLPSRLTNNRRRKHQLTNVTHATEEDHLTGTRPIKIEEAPSALPASTNADDSSNNKNGSNAGGSSVVTRVGVDGIPSPPHWLSPPRSPLPLLPPLPLPTSSIYSNRSSSRSPARKQRRSQTNSTCDNSLLVPFTVTADMAISSWQPDDDKHSTLTSVQHSSTSLVQQWVSQLRVSLPKSLAYIIDESHTFRTAHKILMPWLRQCIIDGYSKLDHHIE